MGKITETRNACEQLTGGEALDFEVHTRRRRHRLGPPGRDAGPSGPPLGLSLMPSLSPGSVKTNSVEDVGKDAAGFRIRCP